MRVCSVIQLCLTLCNPMDYSLQASLLMEFSLPQPGFELASLVSPANKGPLPTKVHLVKAMVFPIVVYGCESWTIKKAESRRIDAFELWYWRRLLRVPWTARRSNQSILKKISPSGKD